MPKGPDLQAWQSRCSQQGGLTFPAQGCGPHTQTLAPILPAAGFVCPELSEHLLHSYIGWAVPHRLCAPVSLNLSQKAEKRLRAPLSAKHRLDHPLAHCLDFMLPHPCG